MGNPRPAADEPTPESEQTGTALDRSVPLATRRALLVSGGATLGAAALPTTGGPVAGFTALLAPEAKDVVAGNIDRVDTDGTLYLRDGVGANGITFTEGATFWRDHAVDLAAFLPGDLVAAEGEQRRGQFVATHLTSVYVVARGQLVEQAQDELRTTGTVMHLTQDSYLRGEDGVVDMVLADLPEGGEVAALGREDPELGFVAIAISVDPHE